MTTIDSRQFRSALGTFTTGVTVVTTRSRDGSDVGLTANSFNSVSLEPPMVLWSLAKSSKSLAAFVDTEYFAVHILSADQDALSNRFATRGVDKFEGLALERGVGEIPLLEGCSARFQCRAAYRYEGGDHEIFVGEVVEFKHYPRPPLIYHGGSYGLVIKKFLTAEHNSDDGEVASSFSMDFLGTLLGRAYIQLFARIRRELGRWEINADEYWLLNLLARFDNRSIDDLNKLFSLGGRHIGSELVSGLMQRGLLEPVDKVEPASNVKLTPAGRALTIELVALAKSVEVDVEKHLDYSESQMLKQLLRQVIRNTNEG